MSKTYKISPEGEIINSTPLGVEAVNPDNGMEQPRKPIDATKLKYNKQALYSDDLIGQIYTGEYIPKSIHRVLGDDYHPEFDPEYNAQLLAASQTNAGKFVGALNQAVIGEIAGGTMEGLSYLLDLPMMLDLAEGTEQEFGNAFTDFAKRLGTWAEEATPIYTDPRAPKFNPTSFEWWMKNAPSVASSISLALPAIGGMKAISSVGKLVGLTQEMGKLGKYSKLFSTATGQAIMSRHMESLMESQGVYDQGLTDAKSKLYEKYSDQINAEVASLPVFTPVDPERGPQPGQYTQEQYQKDLNKIKNKWESIISQEATQVAAAGAANTYSKNWVMLLQDIPEYMLLGRLLKPGAKSIAAKTTEDSIKVGKRLGFNIPKMYASKTAQVMQKMAEEGLIEENYQFLVNEQSSRMIRNLDNQDKPDSILKVFKDNYDNGDLWTNIFFGAIGAGVMQASMAGLNAKAFAESGKARVKNINTWSTLMNKLHSDYVAAEAEGSESDKDAAVENFLAASALKAYEYGNIDHYKTMVSALASDDQNVLSNYEMDTDTRQFFKDRKDLASKIIDKTDNIVKKYNDALTEVTSKGIDAKLAKPLARTIAHSNYMLEFLNKRVGESNQALKDVQISGYNVPTPENEVLSDIGKQIFALRHEKLVLNKRLQSAQNKQKSASLTDNEKLAATKAIERMQTRITDINKGLSELAKDKTIDAEQKKIDKKLLGAEGKADGVISQSDVSKYIKAAEDLQSYERGVEAFKDTLEEVRAEVDALSKVKTKVPETKPQGPLDEDSRDIDTGTTVTYKAKDGTERTGIIEGIEYATKDTEGNDAIPTSESSDNLYTIKDLETGELTHVYGMSVKPIVKESTETVDIGEAADDTDDLDTQLSPVEDRQAINRKDENRRKTNTHQDLKQESGLIEFLSYAHYETLSEEDIKAGKLPKLITLNTEFNKFISDPENQKYLPEATASYSIDLKNADFKKKLKKVREEKGMKRIPLHLLDKFEAYAKGKGKLSADDINLLLTSGPYFRTHLPISVTITINGKQFKDGLYLHTLDKNASSVSSQALREVYDKMRTSIIKHLLNDEPVYTKGLSTNRGNPTNIDKTNTPAERGKNVATTFGISPSQAELLILKSSTKSTANRLGSDGKPVRGSYARPTLYRDAQTPFDAELDFASNGSVFMITKRTVNGQPFAVKLNKAFISKDHAKIIFNAFNTLAKTELAIDQKGGIKLEKRKHLGQYSARINPQITNPEEDVAWNISAGELLQLLVVHGEQLTDPDSPRYSYVNELGSMTEDHRTALKTKRLFLQRGYDQNGNVNAIHLCYGLRTDDNGNILPPIPIETATKGVTKQVDYYRLNLSADNTAEAIGHFLTWITRNKTYAVHLENKQLGQKLNGNFLWGKSFRIGKKGLKVESGKTKKGKFYTYTSTSEIVRKPNESYAEFLINNGLVTTDIAPNEAGQLFDTPFVGLGFSQDAAKDFGLLKGEVNKADTKVVTATEDEIIKVEAKLADWKKELELHPGSSTAPGMINIYRKELEELQSEKKPKKKVKKTGKKQSTREILGGDDIVARERKQSIRKPYDRQDLEKELAWVRKKINIDDDEVEVEKRLANLMLNGKRAWAIYSHDLIRLYEAAEEGTLYHESWHRVSLGYFRKEERESFYRAARQVYSMPKEEFTDAQVEEKLAEEFRTFVLTKQKEAQPSIIKRVFKAIYNFVDALFFGRNRLNHSDIERLFNQIYSGRYRFSKVRKENLNIEPRLREVSGVNFDTIGTYQDVTFYTKYLVKKLMAVHKVPMTDITTISRIKPAELWSKLITNLESTIENLQDIIDDPEQDEAEVNSATKSQAILKDILGEKDDKGEYTKFFAFKYHIIKSLRGMGIVHKESELEDEDLFESNNYDNQISDEEKSSKGSVYNQADYLRPLKDNALAGVKFVINTLHASEDTDESSGLVPYADGNKVWAKLLNDIIKYNNIYAMIDEIKRIGEEEQYYPYIELAELLSRSSETFQTQFQTTFEAHKHEFLNALFYKRGKDGGIFIEFDVAAREHLAKDTARKWNEFIKYDYNIIDLESKTDKTGVARYKVVNKKFFDELADEFQSNIKEYYDDVSQFGKRKLSEKQLEKLFTKTADVLSKMHIDVSTSVLRRYLHNINAKKELQDNLYAFIDNISSIISIETVYDSEKDAISSILNNGKVLSLAEAYADTNAHEETGMVSGPDGASFYKYGKLNYATDNLRKIKRSSEWSDEKVSRVYNKHSVILNSFKDKASRDAFGLMTMSAFRSKRGYDSGREYLEINPVEDYLLKANGIFNGYLPFPIIANRGTYMFMRGVPTIGIGDADSVDNVIVSSNEDGTVQFSDKVLDLFYGYYLDEKERIDKAKEVRDAYLKDKSLKNTLIRNYHYSGDYNLKLGNAYHFIHFKWFKGITTPEKVRAKINKELNDRLKEEIELCYKHDIISMDDKDNKLSIYNKLFDDNILSRYNNLDMPANFAPLSLIAQVMVNTSMSVMECEKMFLGDPALFKRNPGTSKSETGFDVYDEVYKRWLGVGSTGTMLRATMKGKANTYNTAILKTQKFKYKGLKELRNKHEELYREMLISRLPAASREDPERISQINKDAKRLAEDRLKKYEVVDPTDGASYISPEMYRDVLDRMGLWYNDGGRKQRAFDLLQSDKELKAEEILAASNVVFSPLKTMYFGHHNFNGVDLLVYDKTAMFTLFRQHVKGTKLEELLDRMELKGKYANNPNLKKVHVFAYDTAKKGPSLSGISLFDNPVTRNKVADLSEAFIFEQSFEYLKHQQVIDPHDAAKQNFGTAGIKIAMTDVSKGEKYGKFNTGQELLNALSEARVAISNFGIHKVNAKFGIHKGRISNTIFINMLRQDAEAANKSQDFVDALRTDDEGNKYLELDSFNDRKWIYARIKTIVDESTVDLTTPGNQLVQMPDYGMATADYKSELQLTRFDNGVQEMECRVSSRLFKTFFPAGYTPTTQDLTDLLNSNPLIFGYRVPTQGQNSIIKLRVVDFLPEQAGDIIQLPLEFTTVTGSDFDIDKLFVAMYNYDRVYDTDGTFIGLKKIEYSEDPTDTKTRYTNKVYELASVYRHSRQVFGDILSDNNLYKVNRDFKEAIDPNVNNDELYYLESKLQTALRSLKSIKNTDSNKAKHLRDLVDSYYMQIHELTEKLYRSDDEKDRIALANSIDFNVIKEALIKAELLPTLDDFKNLNISEQNTLKANQNRLLDIVFTVLGDEKHFVNMTTPLGTMTDIIEDKSKFYDKVYSKRSTVNLPALATTTPAFQSRTKEKFSSSTFGISSYALHNNHHPLTQAAGVQMASNLKFGWNDNGVIPLDNVIGKDNMYISWWISALIDVHVDGVNKPIAAPLNINEATNDIVNLFIRAGAGEVTFDFVASPAMKDYANNYLKASKRKNTISTVDTPDALYHTYDMYRQMAINSGLFTEEELGENSFSESLVIPLEKLLNVKQLQEDAKAYNTLSKRTKEWYQRQISILAHLKTIVEDAGDLRNFVLACRVDTKKYGANPVMIRHFITAIRNVINKRLPGTDVPRFSNIDKILTANPNYVYKEGDTFLPTLIKNSMFKIFDILKNDSLYATTGFNRILEELVSVTDHGDFNRVSVLNVLSEELVTYFLGRFFADPVNGLGMDFKKLAQLVFEYKEGSIFEQVVKLKNGKLKDNAFISSIIVDTSDNLLKDKEGNGIPYTYILPLYRSLRNDTEKDELVNGFKELIYSEDKALRDLGIKLYIYAFYTTAFRNKKFSYASWMPTALNKEFEYEGEVKSLNNYIKNTLNKLNDPTSITEFIHDAKREIFTNLADSKELLYKFSDKQVIDSTDSESGTPLTISLKYSDRKVGKRLWTGYNANRQHTFIPFIISEDTGLLYEYVGYDRVTNDPYYVVIPSKGFGNKGIMLHELGIKHPNGKDRSIIASNNPTETWLNIKDLRQILINNLSNSQVNNFELVEFENNISVEKPNYEATFGEDPDQAEVMREEEREQAQIDDEIKREAMKSAKAFDPDALDEAALQANNLIKQSSDNKTTKDRPIHIHVDGSAKGYSSKGEAAVLGAGAYAKLYNKEYFLYVNDDTMRNWLTKTLESKGQTVKENANNEVAELFALLNTLDSFKNTSEHLYIHQDYAGALMYFLKNAVNPELASQYPTTQWKDPKDDTNRLLVDNIRNRIAKIEANGGSVRLEYIKTKSTKEAILVDKVAKGEHTIKETRNDFKSEKWGTPVNINQSESKSVASIPQNLVSGVESFGTIQEANSKVKEILGDSPHSIDMIEAGLRTRTTRSVGEMEKYNVKVGDIVTQFGKSADGTTKQIRTRITAIHPKGTPGFLGTWYKEGWTEAGITSIKRLKDGAAAIEFEIVKSTNISPNAKDVKDAIDQTKKCKK